MKDLKEQHDCRMKEYKNKAILGQDLKTPCVEELPFLIDCLYQKIEKMEVREEIHMQYEFILGIWNYRNSQGRNF